MKIYIAHASSYDFRHELYEPIKKSPLWQSHQIFLPHETSNKVINSKEIIKNCDIVVAETSHPSTGMGIELGWANALKIPIICIHKKGQKASWSLDIISNNIIEYTDSDTMIKGIATAINNIPLNR